MFKIILQNVRYEFETRNDSDSDSNWDEIENNQINHDVKKVNSQRNYID